MSASSNSQDKGAWADLADSLRDPLKGFSSSAGFEMNARHGSPLSGPIMTSEHVLAGLHNWSGVGVGATGINWQRQENRDRSRYPFGIESR